VIDHIWRQMLVGGLFCYLSWHARPACARCTPGSCSADRRSVYPSWRSWIHADNFNAAYTLPALIALVIAGLRIFRAMGYLCSASVPRAIAVPCRKLGLLLIRSHRDGDLQRSAGKRSARSYSPSRLSGDRQPSFSATIRWLRCWRCRRKTAVVPAMLCWSFR